jgi:nucleoside-diphosphate-sugar epimerase
MRVLLTGGSGFLGSHVAERLSAEGHDVVALVRKSSNRKLLEALARVSFAEGAIEDRASLDSAVRGVDAIIHCAGLIKAQSRAEFDRANVAGTQNLIDAAKKLGSTFKRFVHVSSGAATTPSFDGRPTKNDAPPAPVTDYGRSKLEAERVAKAEAKNLPITIIRPPVVYGPRDPETFQYFFKPAEMRVLPNIGDPDGKVSVIFAPDCADATIRAIEADVPSGAAYFVTDGVVYTRRDLVAGLQRAVGKKALVDFTIPTRVVRVAASASELFSRATKKATMLTHQKVDEALAQWVFDGSEAEEKLGWKAKVNWNEGTAISAKWYRENGWV